MIDLPTPALLASVGILLIVLGAIAGRIPLTSRQMRKISFAPGFDRPVIVEARVGETMPRFLPFRRASIRAHPPEVAIVPENEDTFIRALRAIQGTFAEVPIEEEPKAPSWLMQTTETVQPLGDVATQLLISFYALTDHPEARAVLARIAVEESTGPPREGDTNTAGVSDI